MFGRAFLLHLLCLILHLLFTTFHDISLPACIFVVQSRVLSLHNTVFVASTFHDFSRHKSVYLYVFLVVQSRALSLHNTVFFVASTFHDLSRHKSTCIRFLSCKVVFCRCITQFFVASTFHDFSRHTFACIHILSCKVVLCRCIT